MGWLVQHAARRQPASASAAAPAAPQAGASLLLGLPWSAYSTFVLEARHGFNKTSPHTFVTDTLKSVLLGLLLIPPLVAAFTAILSRSSPYVGLYLWAFLLALSIFMMVVYPVAIAPLFNKFTPLQEGSLRCGWPADGNQGAACRRCCRRQQQMLLGAAPPPNHRPPAVAGRRSRAWRAVCPSR